MKKYIVKNEVVKNLFPQNNPLSKLEWQLVSIEDKSKK